MSFPYANGLSFVAALHENGGWQRVDDAFVRPPVSTEQILHPERYLKSFDGPVRIEQPSIHGILSNGYIRSAEMRLGEEDLRVFLKQFIDPALSSVAAEGWGGCKVSLYSSEASLPEVLALSSVWDSEDDALEIFGALIGALEMRYPQQTGWAEATNENQILWYLDEGRQLVNVLQLDERRVTLLEQIATDRYPRALLKLERETRYLDPTPDLRRARKDDLVWNQEASADYDSAMTLRVALPGIWKARTTELEGTLADPREVLVAARPGATLQVLVDHEAMDPLGMGGFAHSMAESQLLRAGFRTGGGRPGSDVLPGSDGSEAWLWLCRHPRGAERRGCCHASRFRRHSQKPGPGSTRGRGARSVGSGRDRSAERRRALISAGAFPDLYGSFTIHA
jgi:hypothetical protein